MALSEMDSLDARGRAPTRYERSDEKVAIGAYLLATCMDAGVVLLPLLVLGVGPMTMGATFICGQALGMGGFIVIWCPHKVKMAEDWLQKMWVLTRTKMTLRLILGRSWHWLVLLSVALSGPSLTAVIVGAWPIGWMFLLRREGHQRYRAIQTGTGLGVAAAIVGCCLTVFAQPADVRGSGVLLALGITVAVLAVVVDSQNAVSILWGFHLAESLGLRQDHPTETWCAVVGTTLGCAAAGVIFAGVALAVEGTPQDWHSVGLFGLAGVCLGSPASILSRVAMPKTTKSSVTAVGLLSPAVSVGYLSLFGLIGGVRLTYLLTGVMLVMLGSGWALRTRQVQPSLPSRMVSTPGKADELY